MIGDLGIVHISSPQFAMECPFVQLRLVRTSDGLHHLRQCGCHVGRQMPAIGSGIAEEFFRFVQLLCEFERPLGTEAPETVGVPL